MLRRVIAVFVFSAIFEYVNSDGSRGKRSYDRKIEYMVGGLFGSDMKDSPMRAGFQYGLAMLGTTKTSKFKLRPVIEFVDDVSDSFQITTAMCRLISRQVVAVFGPIHYQTANTIQSLTDYYQILYITPSEANHYYNADGMEQKGRFILKLRPILTGPVIDYISSEGWDRIFYLYDSRQALLRLRSIFENFNNRQMPLSTDVRQLDAFKDPDDILTYMENQSKEHKKRIILDLMQYNSQTSILRQIDELKAVRKDYHFMILGSDINEIDMTRFRFGGFNFTAFSQLDISSPVVKKFIKDHWDTDPRRSSFLTNLDDHLSRNVIPYDAALMIDGVRILSKALNGIKKPIQKSQHKSGTPCISIKSPPYAADKIIPEITKSNYDGLTGPVYFDSLGFRRKFQVNIYGSGVRSNLEKLGNWQDDRKQRLFLSKRPQQLEKGKALMKQSNKTRIVTSILVSPFLMQNHDAKGNPINGSFEGFCVDLIKEVSARANFTFKIKVVNDNSFGSEVNKTSWNGMIGELLTGKADIAVAPLTITSSRERVVDFSTPFMEVGLSIMFKKPDNPPKDVFSFMEPLSNEIWMCIAFAYLGVSVVLFMVSRFNPEEWHHLHNSEADGESKVTNDFSIFNSFWFSLSAFMQQGGDISPRSFSGRIVGGVWWFFTLIIVSSYTANLAAYLTVERMSTPIQSHEDLVKQTKIRYGVVNSGSSKEFFRTNNMATFKKMWAFMESNPEVYVKSMKDGVDRVIHSNQDYAFLLESKMNEYYNQRNPCKTMKVGPNLDSGKGYGIATPSGSDLRDAINLAVLELKEKNRIHELTRRWWEEKGQCGKNVNKEEKSGVQNSLDLENVRGLFYILAGGLAFGITLSIIEFLYKCALEAKRKQRNFGTVLCEMMETSSKGKQRISNTWTTAPPATPMSGLRSSGHPSPIPTSHIPDTMPTRSREKIDMDYHPY